MSVGPEPERVIRLVVDVDEAKPYGTSGRLQSRSSSFSLQHRLARQTWNLVWLFLFRPTPRPFHAWRRLLLRCFGAQVAPGAHVYAGARIWAPWNLVAGRGAAIADGAEIYNPSRIELGEYAVISQGACLCGASHDFESWEFPLLSAPIVIGAHAWIAARAIVRMGVTIGAGCVVGAGSVVTRDLPAWTVCAGVPCRVIRAYTKR
jgi:putative colanic acid biosynthesis acetyltransferase WcaF